MARGLGHSENLREQSQQVGDGDQDAEDHHRQQDGQPEPFKHLDGPSLPTTYASDAGPAANIW